MTELDTFNTIRREAASANTPTIQAPLAEKLDSALTAKATLTLRREVDQWISKTKVELHYIQGLLAQLALTHPDALLEPAPGESIAPSASRHFAEGTWAYDHMWKRNDK